MRCWATKPPPARSRTSASLIGVSLKAKSSTSLASGKLGDRELVFDRAGLLLRDLGLQEIAEEALGLMLAFERRGEGLVVGAPLLKRGWSSRLLIHQGARKRMRTHPVELEAAHHVEDFGSFHCQALLS